MGYSALIKRIVSLHDTLGNHYISIFLNVRLKYFTLKNQKNNFKTTRDVVIKNVSLHFYKNIKYEAFKTHECYHYICILQMNIE